MDLRNAREARQLTLGTFARRIGRSKSYLSRVERGLYPVNAALVRDYGRALGISVAATVDPVAATAPVPNLDDMRRRDLLGAVAAASVGAASAQPLLQLLDGVTTRLPASVGAAEAAAVEAAADLYMRLDLAHGGSAAAALARGTLDWAVGLLGQPMAEATRTRLSSGVGLLADRFGWSLYDIGETDAAARVLTFALDEAARGADRDLRAHVMLDLSTLLADTGRPADGVDVLRMALGDERVSPAERANLHAVCARHCGSAGMRDAGLRHVALSEEAALGTDTADKPDWAHRITLSPGHHDSALGLALFELGDDVRARERLSRALAGLGSGRTRTGLRCRTRLAVLHLRAGEFDIAAEQAHRAISDAVGVRSRRVAADLRLMVTEADRLGRGMLAADLTALAEAA
ncbi:hypothetical protein Cs7R123_75020 [Catellatospora sp. TT07R-123]|uniref:helix-turn-helix domain-containing protein n=1 Tax=Catellatospora sp. TT07R-123 TaxID=2733863 RepID=UPI001AFFA584|nr:helix-turn-helix transcriptional regulator [Catellatospora sp. TT07R-123]GHJ50160.1 hypothetical protein Cs7R123_75020 [Catellatospora sp. TT07R-123]